MTDSPILLLGSSSQDIVGRLESDLQPGTSNPARIRTSYGGVARNVAENLARLGQAVKLVSVVGKDRPGDELLAYTAAAGVDVSAVLRTDLYPTGFYMGVLDPRAHLRFAVDDMRVMSELTPEILQQNQALFENASLVFVDGNLSEASLKVAVSLAKKAKIPICADPASTLLAERLKPHLNKFHLITPNVAEAVALTGQSFESSDPQAALGHLVEGAEVGVQRLLEADPAYAGEGVQFYRRLLERPDAELEAGGLPRSEVADGLARLTERQFPD
jgi:pseudouridine kinase